MLNRGTSTFPFLEFMLMRSSLLALLVVLCGSSLAFAQTRSVEVQGLGVIEVNPDVAFLEGKLLASGETAVEALKEFEDKKSELSSAINPMAFEGIELTFAGVSTFQVPEGSEEMGIRAMGAEQVGEPGHFVVGEEIKVYVKDVKVEDFEKTQRELVKLVDAAKKAEVSFSEGAASLQMQMMFGGAGGLQNLMQFTLSDIPGAKRSAMKQAIEEARKSANELASLTDSKLGKVLEVAELEGTAAQPTIQAIYGIAANEDESEFVTSELGKIKVSVKIRVKFELVDQ
jgi:uncharacterized protein YggE